MDADSDRRSGGWIDPGRLPVQGIVRRQWRGRILPRVAEDASAYHRGNGNYPGVDNGPADGVAGDRPLRLLRVLYPPALYARRARPPAPNALPVPAQQVVFRRALRPDLRPPHQVAWPLPLEVRRRLCDRRLRSRRRVGTGA